MVAAGLRIIGGAAEGKFGGGPGADADDRLFSSSGSWNEVFLSATGPDESVTDGATNPEGEPSAKLNDSGFKFAVFYKVRSCRAEASMAVLAAETIFV